jgi:hypothetical protein
MERKTTEPGRVHWFISDPGEPEAASATAITPIAEWDEPGRAPILAILRFEAVEGRVELVDLHLVFGDRPVAIGAPMASGETLGIPLTLPPGSGFTATSEAFPELHEHLGRPRPWGGISLRLLRALPLGRLERDARTMLTRDETVTDVLPAAWPKAGVRPGRRGHDDRFYADLAREYAAAVRTGSRSPNVDLARRRHLTAARVTALVSRARDKGFLTGTAPGKPGGELTAQARRALGMED